MKRQLIGLTAFLAAGLSMGTVPYTRYDIGETPKPSRNPKRIIPAGCKEFIIRGVSIVALNEKRAWIKYNKLIAK